MNIFRLLYIFLKLRNSGIFNSFINGFNPLIKTFYYKEDSSRRLKIVLEELGPVYIKLGQLLSTRTDIISKELALELNRLTDNCQAIEFHEIKEIIYSELRYKSEKILKTIEKKPIATASLAQVHRFKLQEKEYVIKIQKDGVETNIRRDLSAIKSIIGGLNFFLKDYPRINPISIFEEYEKVILNELDFRLEAANAKKTFENFRDSKELYVPKIVDEFTTKKILVMEYIDGIPITNISLLKKYNIDLQSLSENGVKIFLKQVFLDNFFHADMHPGNIFAAKKNPKQPFYYAVDYAICGSVSESNQILLAQMISRLIDKDFYSLAQLFVFTEWVSKDTKIEELETVLRANCEPLLNQPLSKILFGELLLNLFDAMKPFNLYLDLDLLLLVKTLVHIEGMGRQIYPDLDFWMVAKPFLEDWFKDKYSAKGLVKYLVSKKHILTYMLVKKIEETQQQYSREFGGN